MTEGSGGRLTLQSLQDGKKKLRNAVDVTLAPVNEHDGTGVLVSMNGNGSDATVT